MSDYEWLQLRDDDPLALAPSDITDPALPVGFTDLPFDKMKWEDFESLLGTLLRDGEGLRRFVRLYGRAGQKQNGLDVIAFEADRSVVALQSKKYEVYKEADFRSAVAEFVDSTQELDYDVGRFIIASSAANRDTKIDDALVQLSRTMAPRKLEYWDPHHLSELLRSKPEIVARYFGEHTAKAFCGVYELIPKAVPAPQAVSIYEGLSYKPEHATGAQSLLDEAETVSDEDAVVLIGRAQDLLRTAGFAAFADLHEPLRQEKLVTLGRGSEAAESLIEAVWAAIKAGRLVTAGESLRRLDAIRSKDKSEVVADFFTVATLVLDFVQFPDRDLPTPESLSIGRDSDRAELLLLVGEAALADGDSQWLSSAVTLLEDLLGESLSQELVVRLRMMLADATKEWTELARSARKSQFGLALSSVVLARFARKCVFDQDFKTADESWEDAAASAMLASQWGEAAAWTFSRRVFMGRWNPFNSNKLLPHNIALSGLGPSRPILASDSGALKTALASRASGRTRDAIRAAYRAMRQAVAIGDWAGEEEARKVLAECLAEDEQFHLALMQHARSGSVTASQDLVKEHANVFLDVVAALDSPLYWVVGAAYKALAAEADAIPDAVGTEIADRILRDVRRMEDGAGPDIPAFASSRYGGVVACAAGLAERLDERTAATLLEHFANQGPLDSGQHRFHDKDEAETVAGIAQTHPSLSEKALEHLIQLMDRSEPSRGRHAYAALDASPAIVEPLFRNLADEGSSWAEECLAAASMQNASKERALEAFEQLTTPLEHHRGYTTFGTAAQRDATLVRGLPAASVVAAVESLLTKATDGRAASLDRSEFILAAGSLADLLPASARAEAFDRAMESASTTALEATENDDDPLRLDATIFGRDLRGYFLQASSRFASNDEQRMAVKNTGFALMGVSDALDYRVAAALHPHRNDVLDERDIPILAMQRHWSLRSLAAERWVTLEAPAAVGRFLAVDDDPRVRRSLAGALASAGPVGGSNTARAVLRDDPLHSIRSLATRHE